MTDLLHTIIESLEEDIVLGYRRAGARLVEDDLVDEFDAKKHVVRQALADLERMGLVERIRNKGSVVRTYTPEEVRQVMAVRQMLEAAAARDIPLPADAAYLDRLEAEFKAHWKATEEGDMRQAFRANIRFHQVLFSACGNPYLLEGIEHFALKSHAIRSYSLTDPSLLQQSRNDHESMLDSIRSGDREKLVSTCVEHLNPSVKAYIAAYERFPARQRARTSADQETAYHSRKP